MPVRAQAQEPEPVESIVTHLGFEGNHAIDSYTLATSIATSASSWWATFPLVKWIGLGQKRYFDEREFRRDVLRLRLLYNQKGYPEAQIDTLVKRAGDRVGITFRIREGQPVRVTALTINGLDTVLTVRSLIDELPLAVGDPFDRFLLQASADTIVSVLRNRGYPFVQVYRNFDVNTVDREARVAFDVDPGPRAIVRNVEVIGTQRLSENVVRRMVPLRRGDLFRQDALYTAQRDLYAMDMFNYVSVDLADSVPSGPNDTSVTVRVRVAEGHLHRVRAGAGYGTIDCFRGLAGWTGQNVLGGARTLDLSAKVSKIGTGPPFDFGLQQNLICHALSNETPNRLKLNYALNAGLRQPFLFSRNTSAQIALSGERRSEFQAYLRESVGGDVAVTWRTKWAVPITASYTLEYGRTVADPAVFCSFLNVCRVQDTVFTKRRVQSRITVSASRDRANSLLDPTRGSNMWGEVRWASRLIGSDSLIQFTRLVGEIAFYHRVGRRDVFAWRIRAGTIVSPTLGFSGQSIQFVPPDQRFYGGGPNSVRGFTQNGLGPVVRVIRIDSTTTGNGTQRFIQDTLTSPTGGNDLLFANAELRFPLPIFRGRVTGALFVDAGQVYERGAQLGDFSNLRVTPGFGMRIASPLGPVRLDVAYDGYQPEAGPLYQQTATTLDLVDPNYQPPKPSSLFGRLRLHFSVGQAF